jgi:hypothetical protein
VVLVALSLPRGTLLGIRRGEKAIGDTYPGGPSAMRGRSNAVFPLQQGPYRICA